MKEQVNINIDPGKLTFWQSVKLHYAISKLDTIEVKHENTGLGWVALAIVVAALIMKGVALQG